MTFHTRRIALAAAVLLAACDGNPSAPTSPRVVAPPPSHASSVERMTEEWVSDFDGVFTKFFCDDGTETELVALEGQLYNRNSVVANPAGGYTMTSHSRSIGLRGIGTVTGQEYRLKEQEHYAVSQREIGYAGTGRHVFELTGVVSMQTFKLVVIHHYVVTPDGRIVVEREQVLSECGK